MVRGPSDSHLGGINRISCRRRSQSAGLELEFRFREPRTISSAALDASSDTEHSKPESPSMPTLPKASGLPHGSPSTTGSATPTKDTRGSTAWPARSTCLRRTEGASIPIPIRFRYLRRPRPASRRPFRRSGIMSARFRPTCCHPTHGPIRPKECALILW